MQLRSIGALLSSAILLSCHARPSTEQRVTLSQAESTQASVNARIALAEASRRRYALATRARSPEIGVMLAEASRRMNAELQNHLVPDSLIRQAVMHYYPSALSGGMGPRPYLWFIIDADNRLLRTATGRDGLSRWSYAYLRDSMPSYLANLTSSQRLEVEADGIQFLDAPAVARKFPALSQAGFDLNSLNLSTHTLPGTVVDVAWVQLPAGAKLSSSRK